MRLGLLDHIAVFEDNEMIGEFQRLVEVVSDENDCLV